MKKSVYLLSIIVLMSSCSITGSYMNGDGLGNNLIALNEDRTFEYVTFLDVGGTNTIEGTWSLEKDTLILNSKAQPEFKPSSVEEKNLPNLKKKLILVRNMDVTAYKAVISINEGELIDTLDYIHDSLLKANRSCFFQLDFM